MTDTPERGNGHGDAQGERESAERTDQPDNARVVIIGPDGMAVEGPPEGASDRGEEPGRSVTDLVEQPAKVMRIGSMIKQLLEEVKSAPLDEASRARLARIHARSIAELEDGLAPELIEELDRLALPFNETEVPTEAELRIAQAQLVGWLEGLFHGIQTALFAQQMAARAQFEEIRRRAALPPGMMQPGMTPEQAQERNTSTGQYL